MLAILTLIKDLHRIDLL